MKDGRRRGDTVKPFNEKQSWALLMQLLGGNWKKNDEEGLIRGSEEIAARQFLTKLQGVRQHEFSPFVVYTVLTLQ